MLDSRSSSASGTAIVTGAGGGIGSAIARHLHRAGYDLVLNDRRTSELQTIACGLESMSQRKVEAVSADVTTREGARAVRDRAIDVFGDVTVLVNVVGGLKGPIVREFTQIDDEQWDFAMKVNLRSTFQCMQAALEVMIPRRRGRIVNIASVSWAGSPDHADYAAAKAGVVALTRSVATQVAEHQITVNAVAPGPTLTDAVAHKDPDFASDTPLGRPNIPEDVADAVAFLCSDAARNISGQILNVAGGLNPSI